VISSLRKEFNSRFSPGAYRLFLRNLDACVRTHVGFRVAETPVFFPQSLLQEMAVTGAELTRRLVPDRPRRFPKPGAPLTKLLIRTS
jgi:hypothetical protein